MLTRMSKEAREHTCAGILPSATAAVQLPRNFTTGDIERLAAGSTERPWNRLADSPARYSVRQWERHREK